MSVGTRTHPVNLGPQPLNPFDSPFTWHSWMHLIGIFGNFISIDLTMKYIGTLFLKNSFLFINCIYHISNKFCIYSRNMQAINALKNKHIHHSSQMQFWTWQLENNHTKVFSHLSASTFSIYRIKCSLSWKGHRTLSHTAGRLGLGAHTVDFRDKELRLKGVKWFS